MEIGGDSDVVLVVMMVSVVVVLGGDVHDRLQVEPDPQIVSSPTSNRWRFLLVPATGSSCVFFVAAVCDENKSLFANLLILDAGSDPWA